MGTLALHSWLLDSTSSGRILVVHSLGHQVAYQPVVHVTIRVGRKLLVCWTFSPLHSHFWVHLGSSLLCCPRCRVALSWVPGGVPVVHATIRVGRKLASPESSFRADSQDSFLSILLKITPSVQCGTGSNQRLLKFSCEDRFTPAQLCDLLTLML